MISEVVLGPLEAVAFLGEDDVGTGRPSFCAIPRLIEKPKIA